MPVNQMLLAVVRGGRPRQPGLLVARRARRRSPTSGRSRRARASRSWSRPSVSRSGRQDHDDRVKASYQRLEPASQARYRALVAECREILGLGRPARRRRRVPGPAHREPQPAAVALPAAADVAGADRRHPGAGRPDASSRRPSRGFGSGRRPRDPDSALARSLRATLAIQEKRLENLETAAENLAVIDAELERIEQQVRLVREESAVSGRSGGAVGPPRRGVLDADRDLALDGPARRPLRVRGRRRGAGGIASPPPLAAGGGAAAGAPATSKAPARGVTGLDLELAARAVAGPATRVMRSQT